MEKKLPFIHISVGARVRRVKSRSRITPAMFLIHRGALKLPTERASAHKLEGAERNYEKLAFFVDDCVCGAEIKGVERSTNSLSPEKRRAYSN
jgi:hypothetical protein